MHQAGFDAVAQFNAANAAIASGHLLEAARICREALQRIPGHPTFAVLLSNVICRLGDADEATSVMQAAAPHCTDMPDFWSALANAANTAHAPDAEQVFDYHARYGEALQKSRPDQPLPISDPAPERVLRVGIVNSVFNLHSSVSFFIRPMLRHIPPAIEVTAYHVGAENDAGTAAFRQMVHGWRHMPTASHDDLARQVRQDRIDIVIELIGHTGMRRLPAFQPRCAPVQVSYLGYSNTSGLRSMDWRIVDSITDPPSADRLATERLWRLDPCFLCFAPDPQAPSTSLAPCLHRGHITFGAFSDLFKLNDETLRRWGGVLAAIPGSRLLLKNRAPSVSDALPFLQRRLADADIDIGRVEVRGLTRTYHEHLAMYADMDIVLDTSPYNGTTTLCESLLMGVPIIGVRPDPAHDRHAARVTLSILTATGLSDLIAENGQDLVNKCAELASAPGRLSTRRAELRERLLASPVCDAKGYADRLWAAIRGMWRDRVACAE